MGKVFFHEGDVVKLKQNIDSPEMVVEQVIRAGDEPGMDKQLLGIRCFWFCKNFTIQKNKFNFKDLVIISKASSNDRQ
jgi:uncharacterized protein YodC (DUF2158 family)